MSNSVRLWLSATSWVQIGYIQRHLAATLFKISKLKMYSSLFAISGVIFNRGFFFMTKA
jgi:hypothetical protein